MTPFDAYLYFPPPENPPPPDKMARLTEAVLSGNIAAARAVFEEAFWEKKDFRPDGLQLFFAIEREDRAMTELLVAHGACWNDDGLKIFLPLLGGKPTYAFVTYAIDPGKTLDKLTAVLTERGADVRGAMTIRRDQSAEASVDFVDRLLAAVEEHPLPA